MALGSAIGTGLFYGSSAAIQAAGPLVLLAYIVAGGAVFMVMRAMGEMAVRILLFYVLALGIVMTLVPWNQITGEASPFVQIFEALGIPYVASILNVIVITAAVSSINADTFGSGRTLYALAEAGQAPRLFSRVSRAGVPIASVLMMIGALGVGVVLNALVPARAFHVVTSLATFATVWVWLMILLSHLAMRRRLAREGVRADLFPVPLWPVASYAALAFIIGVIVLLAVFPDTRIALVVGAVWLLAMWGGYEATIGRAQRLSRL